MLMLLLVHIFCKIASTIKYNMRIFLAHCQKKPTSNQVSRRLYTKCENLKSSLTCFMHDFHCSCSYAIMIGSGSGGVLAVGTAQIEHIYLIVERSTAHTIIINIQQHYCTQIHTLIYSRLCDCDCLFDIAAATATQLFLTGTSN